MAQTSGNNDWWLVYLGKPWEAVPVIPKSYNCGELVRAVHSDMLGIDSPTIPIENAMSRIQCVKAMQPGIFGLEPLPEGAKPRMFDVAFLGRRTYLAHCGVAVETSEGLKILHCPESLAGVCLDSLPELRMAGFPAVRWFRHRNMDAALRAHGWESICCE